MLEKGFEGLQDLHLRGDARLGRGLPLHHGHPEGALVARHQALQVLQQQLRKETILLIINYQTVQRNHSTHHPSYLAKNWGVLFENRPALYFCNYKEN